MKRMLLLALALTAALSVTTGTVRNRWGLSTQAKNVRINTNDIAAHGLVIVDPAHPSFNDELSKWLNGKDEKYKKHVESLKPFSVFVKNTNDRDVIGYKVKWEIVGADGEVFSYNNLYFEPESLMGVEKPRNGRGGGKAIRKKSFRLVTSVPLPYEQDGEAGSGMVGGLDADQPQGSGDIAPLVGRLNKQLEEATSVTVSIDGAMFDDGTFVGPDTGGYFGQLRAYVNSKNDLLRMMLHSMRRNEPVGNLFSKIEGIAASRVNLSSADAKPADYYNFYRKQHAEEIMNSRQLIGDDLKAVRHALEPLRKRWAKLHKVKD